jgi:excisionase family DNA binding protein
MHEATPVSEPFPHFERFLNSREAATLLQIHPKTVQRIARNGEIRAMRIGELWRFRVSDLHAWVNLRLQLTSIHTALSMGNRRTRIHAQTLDATP